MSHWHRSNRPVVRNEMARMLLAGVDHEAAEKLEPYLLTHRVHPHLEEARDWITGSSRMTVARQEWGPAAFHLDDLPQ
eukprot:8806229-Pyramimonas_sp.AAC.1